MTTTEREIIDRTKPRPDCEPREHPVECARCHMKFQYVEAFWAHRCDGPRP